MRHPYAGPDGRRHLTSASDPCWLLIGNSRWHWAKRLPHGQWRGWDGIQQLEGPTPVAWAAVGPVPPSGLCPAGRRVGLEDVPLLGCPPWLGVDRALGGWGAWQELAEPVLVVDAGTVLSLTRVDGNGRFHGGRLIAGLRLQLEAITTHTYQIPQILSKPQRAHEHPIQGEDHPDWPLATAAALKTGVERGLAAAVIAAATEADSRWVVLTGGDGQLLHALVQPKLKEAGLAVVQRPLLCLETLALLRPAP